MSKVHFDFGHGGSDPGAVGNGLREKDLTLEIGLMAAKIVTSHGVQASYSRTTDVFVSLSERARMANLSGADVFASIHVNAAGAIAATGTETFSHPSSTKGAILSRAIESELIKDKSFKVSRGTKTANFVVLRLSNMPAALTELGFITNANDAAILKSKAHKKRLAVAIAKGILKDLGVAYKGSSTSSSPSSSTDKESIKELQRDLNFYGYFAGPEDGIMGDKTDKAIRKFQKAHGLGIDGVFGSNSYAALNKFKKDTAIKRNDRGPKVTKLQKDLKSFGWDVGPIDGIAGDKTIEAITQFQRMQGLKMTGEFDILSIIFLRNALAERKANKAPEVKPETLKIGLSLEGEKKIVNDAFNSLKKKEGLSVNKIKL